MKVPMIILSAILSGCGAGDIYENDMSKMLGFCDDKGGLTYFRTTSNYSVRCNNGEKAYKLELIGAANEPR